MSPAREAQEVRLHPDRMETCDLLREIEFRMPIATEPLNSECPSLCRAKHSERSPLVLAHDGRNSNEPDPVTAADAAALLIERLQPSWFLGHVSGAV